MKINKTLLSLSLSAILSTQISTVNADIINADFNGLFTMMSEAGDFALQNGSLPYYYDSTWGYGLRTQISGQLSIDTHTGLGNASINPFEWYNAPSPNVVMNDISLQAIGDGNGGAGNLILGNMLFNWNGTASPMSIVWDASGFLNQSSYYAGQVITGEGALPATDNLSASSHFPAGSLSIGPSPFATTTFNTTPTCTVVNTADCLGVNPSGALPLTDDGIAGSPLIDGPWTGFNPNIDITTVSVTSVVPVPAAVWLFGSGLLTLVGFSRSHKKHSV